MSTINVSTIYTEYVNATGNVFIGGVTANVALRSNNSITVGSNVFMNSSYISVSNSAGNTQINSTSISTTGMTIGGTLYTTTEAQSTDYQVFTANGTWTKPSWAQANDLVTIMMWGGGGGATNISGIDASAGGGGACVIVNKLASQCNSVCNVVVGLGGISATGANGGSGTNSIFYPNTTVSIISYGGAGGYQNTSTAVGGSGGGWYSNGVINGSGGSPLGGALGNPGGASTFGGGGGANSAAGGNASGGASIYGGGGGGKFITGTAGASIYGGGGGAYNAAGGTSTFGGNGGNTTVAAAAPGGGGGLLGNGARGEVRVWVQKVT